MTYIMGNPVVRPGFVIEILNMLPQPRRLCFLSSAAQLERACMHLLRLPHIPPIYPSPNPSHELRAQVRQNLALFLNQPFRNLHERWMKAAPARIPLGSCRGSFTVTVMQKGAVGVRVCVCVAAVGPCPCGVTRLHAW